MKITVQKIIPQDQKNRVIVEFYDTEAHYHQSCEVTVFVDALPNQTLEDVKSSAIQAAREFLGQCQ